MGLESSSVNYGQPLDLTDRGFVILGAGGGGIGTQTSVALAQSGARLLCVDAKADQAEEVAALVGGVAHVANVGSRSAMEGVFAHANELFGGRFSGVVDVIGVAEMGAITGFDDEAIDRQFHANFRHALLATQIAAPMLAARGGGSIVFVSSLAGLRALRGQSVYGMSKAALNHMIHHAAYEFGAGQVRVNGIAPGFVKTPRLEAMIADEGWAEIAKAIPFGRPADPSDIARIALFLLSDLASYVTGNILTADGAMSRFIGMPTISFRK